MSDLSTIQSEFEHDRTVNFAVQQNHVPVVKRLRLTNTSNVPLRDVAVSITAEPDFMLPWNTSLDLLPAGQTIDLGVVDVQLAPAFLAGLTERLAGALTLRITRGESLLYRMQSPIDVLAHDEWNGTRTQPEMIAAFVMPNHPDISRILRQVADILQQWSNDPTIDGYSRKDPQRVRLQLAAIYHALQAQKISYCVPPPSFEAQGQKIRTPDAILEHRLATCLDITLLFAACAEAAGLNPLIIFTEGHAFPGAWLNDESFAESLQDDITLLTKRLAPGVEDICVLEATALTGAAPCSFDDAAALGEGQLRNPRDFHFFIDIRRARASHIHPLPYRAPGQLPEAIEADTLADSSSNAQAPATMETSLPASPGSQVPGARTRLTEWERRLLDLSLRNPLLNFRVTGANIPLYATDLHELEDALANGQDFQIHPRPVDWQVTPRDAAICQLRTHSDPQTTLLREEFRQHRLRADLADKELANRLTQLYRAARTSMEENGANTLYLALGMLVWFETDASQKPRYAPILMVPMEIVRKSVQTGYLLRQREDEPLLNITLLEMLRQDFGIEVTGLQPLPCDENGVDVKSILAILRRAIMHKARWDVLDTGYIGLFSFSKFVMWHDLRARSEELSRNKVVASLMAGSLQWTPTDDSVHAEELDSAYHPQDILCPISADSSQLTAICAAGEGKSLVLHGPPGTGKSQTITNLIAHMLAQGKSVLFVAEKMAALTVVQRRLAQIGLAPFCLEVHSNKSRKRDVLEQLRVALEIGRTGNPDNWQGEAQRLATLRKELNDYVQALHCRRRIGLSVFQALARLSSVRQAKTVVHFTGQQVTALTADDLQQWHDLTRQLRVAGESCGHPHGHIWSASARQEYQPQVRAQTVEAISACKQAFGHWRNALAPVAARFGVNDSEPSYRVLAILKELTARFLAAPAMPGAMVCTSDWDDVRAAVDMWISHGRHRDRLRHSVFARYDESVLRLNAAELHARLQQADTQWALPRFFARRAVMKTLRATLKPGMSFMGDRLAEELMEVSALQEEEGIVVAASERARELFGQLWQEGNADWDAIAGASQWAGDVRKLAVMLHGNDLAKAEASREHWARLLTEYREAEGVLAGDLRIFNDAAAVAVERWQALSELLAFQPSALVEDEQAPAWFNSILTRLTQWEENLDRLRDWCAWVRVRAQAVEVGLLPLITPYEQGDLAHAEVEAAFTHGLLQAWAEEIITNDSALSTFSRGLFEDKIRQFREMDDHFAQLTGLEVFARLAARVPRAQGDAVQNSEMGILGRELQKQKNHLALRSLFQKIPNLLPRLKPCLLMSPMSVAQYLDPAHPPFDLVIFDEASQVPTCDAVGAIARGNEALIVGDPKQLPPTNFFTALHAEEDDEYLAMQDLESILDDCLAIRVPEERLRWHYRSRHESLIAFSNHQYYDNSMFTFPSPDDLTPNVRFIPIDGVYDRGKTKQNRAEADAIVAEIFRRLRDPNLNTKSIGVVTFSQVQQQLIEDLLDEQLRLAPELEPFFAPETLEPVFVKNLENVQGDERDIILFSIGYGPDEQGRVSMNFGPLNQEGGWRRLNVAISRARQQMMIFSTLRPEQLDTSRTNARGVADLKAFLEYSERGKQMLFAQRSGHIEDAHESLFEEQICQALRERGHQVATQVGCSGYRIDLAIIDPDASGRYLLGIECDGATYHHAKTARDRDKLREMVLRGLGWHIHRIWSTDWWENPEHEIARIEESLSQAKSAAPAPVMTPPTPPLIVTPLPANAAEQVVAQSPIDNATPYAECRLTAVARSADDFYLPIGREIIAAQIRQLLNSEAPLSHSLLARRIIDAWGIGKLGSRINARIHEICAELPLVTTQCKTHTYYWAKSAAPADYVAFRTHDNDPASRRDAEDIPPEEIANAALHVLRGQISLPEADLIRETARLFGFQRPGSAVEQHLRQGIDLLLKRKQAIQDSEGRIVHRE